MTQQSQEFRFETLSLDERALLAHDLWESVQHEVESSPLSADQLTEIRRRVAEADGGRISSAPWETVKLRLINRK